ncbi:heparan-alpha-glucosaminide N-acetyltransferase [Butyrivibrio sp. WCE2006]|uniref:heparan-alpha-glucosaminide N-acetyltransferase n=1 Tax=Butyrivibrio sp. WCE2006 TaxID=1410611 RepID=UPI0005D1CC8E|nr:heparan-alpha-glucosaminide N-acetyltransferase [Butyrivibrio sp. WCE2006]
MQTHKSRLETIDTIRGITLISMILYHFCWDLKYIKGLNMPWYGTFGSYLWQQSICWSFILISGFCMHFARKPIRNGVLVFLCGIIITCVTVLVLPDAPVYFGVLTFLGSAMILLGAVISLYNKINSTGNAGLSGINGKSNGPDLSVANLKDPLWGLFISVVLFAITKPINRGFLNLFVSNIALPDTLYGQVGQDVLHNSYLTYLGFMQNGFYSSDYFSLMPWIFLFIAGYFLHSVIKKKFGLGIFHINIKPLSWIGRHSLIIYMLHQPVLYGITMIL